MIRTQISLTDDQMRRLRAEARRRHVSIAAVIRDAVEARVPPDDWDEVTERAMAVVGKYDSGYTDIAENHDLYLDPDYQP